VLVLADLGRPDGMEAEVLGQERLDEVRECHSREV
jgi:hypothetical protein